MLITSDLTDFFKIKINLPATHNQLISRYVEKELRVKSNARLAELTRRLDNIWKQKRKENRFKKNEWVINWFKTTWMRATEKLITDAINDPI